MRWRTVGRVLVQVAVSAAFLGVLVWRGDLGDLQGALRRADWWWVAAAAVLVAGSKAMHGVRWWMLVRRAGEVPLTGTVLVLLAATGVSVIVPLRAGAALQLQVLRRRYGVERAAVAGTLVLEGLLDAATLLIVALLTAPFLHLRRHLVMGGLVTAAITALLVGLLLVLVAQRRARRWTGRLPPRLRRPAETYAASLGRGFAAAGSPRYLALLLGVTLLDWTLAAIGFALVGRAFGLGVPLHAYFAVEIAANLSAAVPFTQANVGPYEVAVRETLAAFGARGRRAGAFAVASHAAVIVADVLIGLGAAWALRLRPEDIFYLNVAEAPDHRNADSAPGAPPQREQ